MKNSTPTAQLLKLAAIRDENYPMGQAAACHFNCPCGTRLPALQDDVTCPECPRCWGEHDEVDCEGRQASTPSPELVMTRCIHSDVDHSDELDGPFCWKCMAHCSADNCGVTS